ncbi:FtsX-like permease family protein [Amycolatopsis sp. NPDC088138]|uniref:FtsX-like permease family protein n=1 Tax=Amycolatopsis sp. NPDC088138 TaxID=3363938 RepID=UPI0038235381
MVSLALRLFRHHRGSAVATGLVAVTGMALVVAMAALLGTGLAGGTAAADRAFLVQFPLIMGGWVVAIVLFAMVSTIGVTLGGRAAEIRALRLTGAEPRQVRVLVSVETLLVALVAAVPGLGAGYLLGALLMRAVRATGLIAPVTVYAPGPVLPLGAVVVVLAAAALAAWLGSRAPAGASPVAAAEPAAVARRSGRGRRVSAAVLLVAGAGSASAVFALPADSIATTAMTGPATVLTAIGLAVLAPELLAAANAVVRLAAPRSRGAGTYLAAVNLAAAPERTRPVVTFLTLLVGVSAGTLAMQGIENRHTAADSVARVLASINYFVVVLIALFMAIALANNLIAALGRRRTEFAVLALLGSTGRQTRGMVLRETAVAALTAVFAAGAGALVCVVPFAVVKTGSAAAAFAAGPFLLSGALGLVVALVVTAVAGGRTIRAAAPG